MKLLSILLRWLVGKCVQNFNFFTACFNPNVPKTISNNSYRSNSQFPPPLILMPYFVNTSSIWKVNKNGYKNILEREYRIRCYNIQIRVAYLKRNSAFSKLEVTLHRFWNSVPWWGSVLWVLQSHFFCLRSFFSYSQISDGFWTPKSVQVNAMCMSLRFFSFTASCTFSISVIFLFLLNPVFFFTWCTAV